MERVMEHVIEPASSGRAKCRGCSQKIDKGVLRFGEQVENPYNDGTTTLWFHLACGASKRPEPFLAALESSLETRLETGLEPGVEGERVPDHDQLVALARRGLDHRRLTRIDGLQRARSGRASCRHCREPIAKDTLRIKLVWFEAGRFEPSGFLHVGCAHAFCESDDVLPRLRRFSEELPEETWSDVQTALTAG